MVRECKAAILVSILPDDDWLEPGASTTVSVIRRLETIVASVSSIFLPRTPTRNQGGASPAPLPHRIGPTLCFPLDRFDTMRLAEQGLHPSPACSFARFVLTRSSGRYESNALVFPISLLRKAFSTRCCIYSISLWFIALFLIYATGKPGARRPRLSRSAVPGFSCGHFLGLPLLEASLSIIEGIASCCGASDASYPQTAWLK